MNHSFSFVDDDYWNKLNDYSHTFSTKGSSYFKARQVVVPLKTIKAEIILHFQYCEANNQLQCE